mmetsp:Transcript_148114/g.258418  ORF Transcript_148114/g.258418 Transcript_148114/m.258418 type:complete len:306 (-) Transcript_148114:244-1161(-)
MAGGTDDWADKLVELYAREPEKLATLMMYITDHPEHQLPLNKLARVESAFKHYVDKIDSESDGTIAHYLDETQLVAANHAKGFQLKGKEAFTMFSATGAAVLEKLPAAHQKHVVQAISTALKNSNFEWVKNLGKSMAKNTGTVVKYAKYGGFALMGVQLSWEAISSMKAWWQGEISGKRAAKQIVDCTCALGAGFAGGEAGFVIGSMAGPVGSGVGALVGGVVGSLVGASLTDSLTQMIFDVPKDAALENAYNFLGVHHDDDNYAVNKKFKELCLKYHPDKGGKAEDFHKLQVSMQVIRLARGQA